MDKSRQYIQMCKTSKEIQSKWKQKPGDLFFDIDNNIACWTIQTSNSCKIKSGFKIQRVNSVIKLEKFFWLPKLDQLIENAQSKKKPFRDTSFDFFEWSKNPYSTDSKSPDLLFTSIEQLWLAYVMEKNFSKKWVEGLWTAI